MWVVLTTVPVESWNDPTFTSAASKLLLLTGNELNSISTEHYEQWKRSINLSQPATDTVKTQCLINSRNQTALPWILMTIGLFKVLNVYNRVLPFRACDIEAYSKHFR